MASVSVGQAVLCTGELSSLTNLYQILVDSPDQPGGINADRRASQIAALEQRYRVADEGHAVLSPGRMVRVADGGKTVLEGAVGTHPDYLRMKSALVLGHDMDVPENWLVFGCTRPIFGHEQNIGNAQLYLRGRFRAAVNPEGDRAAWMIAENFKNDASVIVTAADREEILAMALLENEYQSDYLDQFQGEDLWRQLMPQVEDLSEMKLGDLLWHQQKTQRSGDLIKVVRNVLEASDGLPKARSSSGPRFG